MHPRRYLARPALSDFALVRDGRSTTFVRRGFEASAHLLGLAGDPPSGDTISGGRARHPVVALPDGSRAVVRRYHRGGAVRHVNRWTYFAGHRAFHELLATETARAAGVRVPLVLAATERRAGIGYHAWLATQFLDGALESAAWLASASADARLAMLAEAGRQIGLMHGAGIAHPDLNLRNLLVTVSDTRAVGSAVSVGSDPTTGLTPSKDSADPRQSTEVLAPAASTNSAEVTGASPSIHPVVHLIDFDGAKLFDGPAPASIRAANLRRLARSARKLGAPIGPAGWAAMAEGYGAAWPLSAAETRDLG